MIDMPFIEITFSEDEERITSPMPDDCSYVDARLDDGTIVPAYFEKNIADAGDWDFMDVDEHGEPGMESWSDRIKAWRYTGASS